MSNSEIKNYDFATGGLALAAIDAVAIIGVSIPLFNKINSLEKNNDNLTDLLAKTIKYMSQKIETLEQKQDYMFKHILAMNEVINKAGLISPSQTDINKIIEQAEMEKINYPQKNQTNDICQKNQSSNSSNSSNSNKQTYDIDDLI